MVGNSTAMDTSKFFTKKKMKGLWNALYNSHIPIVTIEQKPNLDIVLENLRIRINSQDYLPSVPHGYLGVPKGNGVTRFLPVLTKEDLLVYYSMTLSLEDFLIQNVEGIFGAYQVVPDKAKKKPKNVKPEAEFTSDELLELDLSSVTPLHSEYGFENSIAKKAWFKDWQKFVDYLQALIEETPNHYKLVTSDIANFYDTINIDKLSNKISRQLAKKDGAEEFFDISDLLLTFLKHWDRRLAGYRPSTKGIPQEIVSDASRIIANFYLNDFDIQFKKYCHDNGLLYTRWADDLIILGKSDKQLELAIHKASRILLKDGLHLNSSKTQIYSKSKFVKYRALDLMTLIAEGDVANVDRYVKSLHGASIANYRIDSVFKALLNFCSKNKNYNFSIKFYEYMDSCFDQYSIVSTLSNIQMLKLIQIQGEPLANLRRLKDLILSKPYAAPKTIFLKLLWKSSPKLQSFGFSKQMSDRFIAEVLASSIDSTVVTDICIPEFSKRIERHFK